MIFSAIISFFIAFIFELIVLGEIFNSKSIPKLYAYWYCILSFIGVAILFVAVSYGDPNPIIITILAMYILLALLGLILFTTKMFKNPLAKWLTLIHAIAGLFVLIFLVYYLLHFKKDSTSIYAERTHKIQKFN